MIFPAFLCTQRFTIARNLSASGTRLIQSTLSHSNIILPFACRPPKWFIFFIVSRQSSACVVHLLHTCHMPRQSHSRFQIYEEKNLSCVCVCVQCDYICLCNNRVKRPMNHAEQQGRQRVHYLHSMDCILYFTFGVL